MCQTSCEFGGTALQYLSHIDLHLIFFIFRLKNIISRNPSKDTVMTEEEKKFRLLPSSSNCVSNVELHVCLPDILTNKNFEKEICSSRDIPICLPSTDCCGDRGGEEDISAAVLPTSITENDTEEKTRNFQFLEPTYSTAANKKSKLIMKWKLLPSSTPSSSSAKEEDGEEVEKNEEDTKKSRGKRKTNEKPVPCQLCNKIFKNIFRLNNHLRNKHDNDDVTFTCDECGKEFSHVNGLRRHSKIHNEEKQFKCELCGQTFRYNYHLKRHMGIHAGEKPHKCQYCFKHFNRKFNLKEHLRVHTGVKPYQCELCLKQFTQKSTLQNHMKVHNSNSNNEEEGVVQ